MLSGLASLHFAWPALALLAPLPWLLRRLLPPQSTPYALPLPGVHLCCSVVRNGGRITVQMEWRRKKAVVLIEGAHTIVAPIDDRKLPNNCHRVAAALQREEPMPIEAAPHTL